MNTWTKMVAQFTAQKLQVINSLPNPHTCSCINLDSNIMQEVRRKEVREARSFLEANPYTRSSKSELVYEFINLFSGAKTL